MRKQSKDYKISRAKDKFKRNAKNKEDIKMGKLNGINNKEKTNGGGCTNDLADCCSYLKRMFNYSIDNYNQNDEPLFLACTTFHTALAKGDIAYVRSIFATLNDSNLSQFVANTPITFHSNKPILTEMMKAASTTRGQQRKSSMTFLQLDVDVELNWQYPKEALLFEHPLALAASSGNPEVVDILIQNGVDLCRTDTKGNSILHNLVLLSKEQPDIAVAMFKHIGYSIGMNTGTELKHRLAFIENDEGETALEQAARLCLPEMLLAIIQWDNVYRFVLDEYGPFQHAYYDVTRYETRTNRNHLLKWITYADESDIKRLSACRFLHQEPIKTWVAATHHNFHLQHKLWTISWCVFVCVFFFSAYEFLNEPEQCHPPKTISWFLILFSLGEMLSQINILVVERALFGMKGYWSLVKAKGPHEPMAFTPIYRIFQFLCAFLLIPLQFLHLARYSYTEKRYTYVCLYIFTLDFALISLMLFIQLNSRIGHLSIIFDKMVHKAVMIFSSLAFLFVIFPACFQILTVEPLCHTSNDSLPLSEGRFRRELTSDNNHSLWGKFYEATMLSVGYNMPSSLYFEESTVPELSLTVYILLIVIFEVVILNLTIAVMSESVAELNMHKETILGIMKLSVPLSILNRTRAVQRICSRFEWVRTLFRRRKEKYLVFSQDDSQVFLRVIEKMRHLRYDEPE